MTAPLTGPEVDLRDCRDMPLDVVRLWDSECAARATGEGFRAAVFLWCAAWHQVPAASLPADDRLLARLAGCGVGGGARAAWRDVREDALRGFVKCDDGRLYHPAIAEMALETWLGKAIARKSGAAGNAKRYGRGFDPAPFDATIKDTAEMLAVLNPSSRSLERRFPRTPVGVARVLH